MTKRFEFSDDVLKFALECLWQFIGNRGAEETRYERSLERRLKARYLDGGQDLPYEIRMLRTTGDWNNSAWELDDRGYHGEYADGVVTSPSLAGDNAHQREQLFKLCLSIMTICGPMAVREGRRIRAERTE